MDSTQNEEKEGEGEKVKGALQHLCRAWTRTGLEKVCRRRVTSELVSRGAAPAHGVGVHSALEYFRFTFTETPNMGGSVHPFNIFVPSFRYSNVF